MSHCTCCHLCHVSMKQRPRQLLACSACNAILCRTCLETRWKTDQWQDDALGWVCHKCRGECPCKSCKGRNANARVASNNSAKRAAQHWSLADELDFDFAEPVANKQQRVRASLHGAAMPAFVHAGATAATATQRLREQPRDRDTVNGMRGLLMLLEEERNTLDVALSSLIKETSAAVVPPVQHAVVAPAAIAAAVAPIAAVSAPAVAPVTGGGMKRSASASNLPRSNSACNLEVLAMLAMPDAAAAWRGGGGGVF